MAKKRERGADFDAGTISADGFLGSDSRGIDEIISSDDELVRQMGLTRGMIASRMREMLMAGAPGLGGAVRVHQYFEVIVESARGRLPCPFADGVAVSKNNVTVKNLETGKESTFSDLNIHLIEEHGFFEGTGSPYRLDPGFLADVLELRGR